MCEQLNGGFCSCTVLMIGILFILEYKNDSEQKRTRGDKITWQIWHRSGAWKHDKKELKTLLIQNVRYLVQTKCEDKCLGICKSISNCTNRTVVQHSARLWHRSYARNTENTYIWLKRQETQPHWQPNICVGCGKGDKRSVRVLSSCPLTLLSSPFPHPTQEKFPIPLITRSSS